MDEKDILIEVLKQQRSQALDALAVLVAQFELFKKQTAEQQVGK